MTADLAVYETTATPGPPALFGTDDPSGIIDRARAIATPLADVIRERKLFVGIQGREHVTIQGWTLLGSMLGVFPVTAWCRSVESGSVRGWEARVEARTLGGAVVGAAEAQCMEDEPNWGTRERKTDNQRRSMAQTRAASKALRLPLGFIMSLAGYDPTPAEEMDAIEGSVRPAPPTSSLAQRIPAGLVTRDDLKRLWEAAKQGGVTDRNDLIAIVKQETTKSPEKLTLSELEKLIAQFTIAPAEEPERDALFDGAEYARPVERLQH